MYVFLWSINIFGEQPSEVLWLVARASSLVAMDPVIGPKHIAAAYRTCLVSKQKSSISALANLAAAFFGNPIERETETTEQNRTSENNGANDEVTFESDWQVLFYSTPQRESLPSQAILCNVNLGGLNFSVEMLRTLSLSLASIVRRLVSCHSVQGIWNNQQQ